MYQYLRFFNSHGIHGTELYLLDHIIFIVLITKSSFFIILNQFRWITKRKILVIRTGARKT